MKLSDAWKESNHETTPYYVILYFVGNTISIAFTAEQEDYVVKTLEIAIDGKIQSPPVRTVLKLNGYHLCLDMLHAYTFRKWTDEKTVSERQVEASEKMVKVMEKAIAAETDGDEWKHEGTNGD